MKKRNNLDEMQEQKMLQIEHRGVWLAFWGLAVVMLGQMLLNRGDFKFDITGEWIVFMVLCVYIIGACIKNGIWDRTLQANPKTNVIVSIVAAGVMGIFGGVNSYMWVQNLKMSIISGLILAASVFILCIVALAIVTKVYKKRVESLEKKLEE